MHIDSIQHPWYRKWYYCYFWLLVLVSNYIPAYSNEYYFQPSTQFFCSRILYSCVVHIIFLFILWCLSYSGAWYYWVDVQQTLTLQAGFRMMLLTLWKQFLMLCPLFLQNLLLRSNYHGIHCGPNLTNFMVMGTNCSLFAVTMRESWLLLHARYIHVIDMILSNIEKLFLLSCSLLIMMSINIRNNDNRVPEVWVNVLILSID